VVLPADVMNLLDHRHKTDRQPAIEQDAVRRLTHPVVSRIKRMASSTLRDHRHLGSLLYAWSWWGEGTELQEWTEALAASPAGLARLAEAFNGYGSSDHQHPLVKFINFPAAMTRAREWLAEGAVADDDKAGLQSLIDQVQRLAHLHGVHTDLVSPEEG